MGKFFITFKKILLYALIYLCAIVCGLCIFYLHKNQFVALANVEQNYNYDVGNYALTLVAASGTVASGAGGSVQINGGTISEQESRSIAYQTPTTAQAYVNTGYEFSGWYTALIGGQLKTRNATFSFNMPSEDTTFYAIFTVNRFFISAVSSPSGAGNLTGGGTHNYNSEVTLRASPINANYEFYRWIRNGVVVSLMPDYLFTVVEDASFIAEFKVKLSVSISGAGSVNLNGNSNFTENYFLPSENVILEAIPDLGYRFKAWSSGSTSSSPTINVLVGTTAKTYVANFELIGAQLFIDATAGGNIEGSSPSAIYPSGEVVNLVANAEIGHHFLYWEGEYSGNLQNTLEETSYIVTLDDVLRNTIHFTAVFERDFVALNLYSVTGGVIDETGGLVAINEQSYYGSVTKMLPPEQTVQIDAVKKSGYKFLGWYTKASDGDFVSSLESYEFLMPINELSLYAVFHISYWYEYRISPTGSGSELDPYIINTENELAWLAYTTNTGLSFSNNIFVKLNNHLDLSAYMWEPIGNNITLSTTSKWQVSFDGGGYVISGVNIDKQNTGVGYSGLFGSIYGANAKVFNLGLEDVNIKIISNYNAYVGSIAGQVENSNIFNCYVKNSYLEVTNNAAGHNYVGGLVGNNVNGKIRDSFVFVNITNFSLNQNLSYLGALAGNNYGSSAVIEDIYSISEVIIKSLSQPTNYLGALVGYNSLGALLKNNFYGVEHTNINAIGVNNSIETNNIAKTLEELKRFDTYVNEVNAWNFEASWLMPTENQNEGYPILRGVGNLIVNANFSQNGTITPSGQRVYFKEDARPTYVIAPIKNYELGTLLVNGEGQVAYKGAKNASTYIVNNKVGVVFLEATFIEQIKEPINIFVLILILTPILLVLWFIIKRLFGNKLDRKKIIRGAIKKQKIRRKNAQNSIFNIK
jgi:uncharacterized repeat protein (TIGR02543 family)